MRTILVVDDELTVRSLLHDVLELEGFRVREAEDGPTALVSLHERRIEVLTEIRQDPELAPLPVLMLTAAGDDGTTWAGWQAGCSTYLDKPFDHAQLLDWIERLLQDSMPVPSEGHVYELDEAV